MDGRELLDRLIELLVLFVLEHNVLRSIVIGERFGKHIDVNVYPAYSG